MVRRYNSECYIKVIVLKNFVIYDLIYNNYPIFKTLLNEGPLRFQHKPVTLGPYVLKMSNKEACNLYKKMVTVVNQQC